MRVVREWDGGGYRVPEVLRGWQVFPSHWISDELGNLTRNSQQLPPRKFIQWARDETKCPYRCEGTPIINALIRVIACDSKGVNSYKT